MFEDIELRGNEEVLLDAMDVEATRGPTTAGDFCHRFSEFDNASPTPRRTHRLGREPIRP